MSENNIVGAATDRAAIERWEDEGGRVVELENRSGSSPPRDGEPRPVASLRKLRRS